MSTVRGSGQYFEIEENESVLLVDDSPNNIAIAKSNGHHVVLVPKSHTKNNQEQEINVTKPDYIDVICEKMAELSCDEQSFDLPSPTSSFLPSYKRVIYDDSADNVPDIVQTQKTSSSSNVCTLL